MSAYVCIFISTPGRMLMDPSDVNFVYAYMHIHKYLSVKKLIDIQIYMIDLFHINY
jgi:hypothetical protein